jgi:hypothetical protein
VVILPVVFIYLALMNMNGKLPSMFACFLPYRDSHQENVGKKIGQKILPRDSKRMRLVRIFGILAVQELPFHLRYRSFGSLMPVLLSSNAIDCEIMF